MKYLENNICDFEILFDLNPKIKKNIISVCFFKLYSNVHRNFNEYVDGLFNLYDVVLKEKKFNFVIRLFLDISIQQDEELFSRLVNKERIEIVIYKCEKYLKKESNKCNTAFFGTLVRYFPMFDFPNNDANIVLISDIDEHYHYNINMNYLNSLQLNKISDIYFLLHGDLNKNIKYNFELLYLDHITPYILSSNIINFKRIDHNLIIDYTKNIKKFTQDIFTTYDYYYSICENKQRWLELDDKFIYGFDELFINRMLVPYLIDNKKPYILRTKWDVIEFAKSFIKFSNNKKQTKLIELIFKYIFDKLNIKTKSNNLENYLNKLNEIDLSNSDLINKFVYYFYKVLEYNKFNKNYNFIFTDDLYKMIKLLNIKGFINFKLIIYYLKNSTKTIFIKKQIIPNQMIKKLTDFPKNQK